MGNSSTMAPAAIGPQTFRLCYRLQLTYGLIYLALLLVLFFVTPYLLRTARISLGAEVGLISGISSLLRSTYLANQINNQYLSSGWVLYSGIGNQRRGF